MLRRLSARSGRSLHSALVAMQPASSLYWRDYVGRSWERGLHVDDREDGVIDAQLLLVPCRLQVRERRV